MNVFWGFKKIIITAPASKPVITDSKGIEVRNVSGLYDSGTPLTLICTVTQGKYSTDNHSRPPHVIDY